jgi:hypothetical protein
MFLCPPRQCPIFPPVRILYGSIHLITHTGSLLTSWPPSVPPPPFPRTTQHLPAAFCCFCTYLFFLPPPLSLRSVASFFSRLLISSPNPPALYIFSSLPQGPIAAAPCFVRAAQHSPQVLDSCTLTTVGLVFLRVVVCCCAPPLKRSSPISVRPPLLFCRQWSYNSRYERESWSALCQVRSVKGVYLEGRHARHGAADPPRQLQVLRHCERWPRWLQGRKER